MSRIANRIRAYVDDTSCSDHYGEWGILRPDQRRQIRELCDTCDMYERTADELARKQSEGCGSCGTTLYVKTVQHTMPLLAPITRAEELRHELLNLTGEIYLPIEARFCPLCGAKMKGGAEE